MGLPARHDSGSLNCRPGTWCSSSSGSVTSVTVDAAGRVLAGIVDCRRPEDAGSVSWILLLIGEHSRLQVAYPVIILAASVLLDSSVDLLRC